MSGAQASGGLAGRWQPAREQTDPCVTENKHVPLSAVQPRPGVPWVLQLWGLMRAQLPPLLAAHFPAQPENGMGQPEVSRAPACLAACLPCIPASSALATSGAQVLGVRSNAQTLSIKEDQGPRRNVPACC